MNRHIVIDQRGDQFVADFASTFASLPEALRVAVGDEKAKRSQLTEVIIEYSVNGLMFSSTAVPAVVETFDFWREKAKWLTDGYAQCQHSFGHGLKCGTIRKAHDQQRKDHTFVEAKHG